MEKGEIYYPHDLLKGAIDDGCSRAISYALTGIEEIFLYVGRKN